MTDVRFIKDIDTYITLVDGKIDELKKNGRKAFVDFTVKFQSTKDVEAFQKYFSQYNVEMNKCPLGNYDIIIRW